MQCVLCVYVTYWLCHEIRLALQFPSATIWSLSLTGLAISAFFLCYGIIKSWDKTEAEGVFGGKLLWAGAFTDKTQRWNWSVDMIFIGFGLWTAQAGLFAPKEILIYPIVYIMIFILMYAYFWKREANKIKKKEDLEDEIKQLREDLAKLLKVSEDEVPFGHPSSVYVDPSSVSASLVFQVFVPQVILIVLYVAVLFHDIRPSYSTIGFAILGAFFIPITLHAADIPDYVHDFGFMKWYRRLQLAEKLHLISRKDGNTAPRLSWFYARSTAHVIVNLIFPFFVCVTLPGFLANSPSPSEFVLNAMAIIYVIQLDNIPAGQRVEYMFSNPAETSNVP